MRDEDPNKLFRDAMADVRPLKTRHRVRPAPPRPRIRRPSSLPEVPDIAPVPSDDAHWEQIGDRVFWQRSSLRPQEINRLKKGQFAKHWLIDLHGLTQDEAATTLKSFLRQAWSLGARHALIIHGKGYNSEAGPVLRQMVHQMLPTLPFVLAFSTAQPQDGDTGATYVFLKAQQT